MNDRAARTSSIVGGSSALVVTSVAITADATIGATPEIDRALREAIAGRRCLFVAGLPGSGKSLVVQRAAAIARELGRAVHLLQWDVARLAFDTPEILARYPEVAGVTHAAIRVAVGRWARGAVGAWHQAHPGGADALIGETPLVGERLASLARPQADAVEPLLASAATLFLVPVPSPAVRTAIEAARAREMAGPLHERDRASAALDLVRWHWDDLVRVARELAVAGDAGRDYDPDLYARTYERLLRHRRSVVVPLEEVLAVRGSVHAVPAASELVPTEAEVASAMAAVASIPAGDLERAASHWYRR